MQGHSQNTGNVISLCAWRAARFAPGSGQRAIRQDNQRDQAQCDQAQCDQALRRLEQFQQGLQPGNRRLLTALNDLDNAVQDLGQSMSELEGRVVQLHDCLGHALTRLEAQRQQNDQVIACLDSGDVAAMEDCRRRISSERRKASRTH
ncbi:MAG: hypothetical protein RIB84_03735 [Sneathiellaceae bacterium]